MVFSVLNKYFFPLITYIYSAQKIVENGKRKTPSYSAAKGYKKTA